MHRLATFALFLVACSQPDPGATTTTTGECAGEGCTCPEAGDCGPGLACASNICVAVETSSSGGWATSTGGSSDSFSSSGSSGSSSTSSGSGSSGVVEVCGDGVVGPGETCDDGAETKLCDSDCTAAVCGDARMNVAAGEECDDGNVDNSDGCRSDCTAAACGDGVLHVGVEECDDGNLVEGDGCDAACLRERWAHVGVAHDVPVADLVKWEPEPCWIDTYEAGDLVDDLPAACEGDHLLMACRPAGADTLTLAAHGPREAVLQPVDYKAGERSTANGVDFFWSQFSEGVIGFGPPGEAWCYPGQSLMLESVMCWRADDVEFLSGYRCGAAWNSLAPGPGWERTVFQAWD